MRHFYSLLLHLLTPFIILRLLWRSMQAPDYIKNWQQRFGFFYPKDIKNPIWIHAVSLGETQAALPLIRQLQSHYPQQHILITNMTPTGAHCAKQISNVQQCYLPYDYPWAVKFFLQQIQPTIGIIMETELWPNLLHHARQKHIPMILANARLSARSAQGYQRYAKQLTAQTLACFSTIAVQTDTEAQRFIQLGAKKQQLSVTGSIKFDVTASKEITQQGKKLRQQWGKQRRVLIAASTHEGEDEMILQTFSQLKQQLADLLLIIVPRHPERFAKVVKLCQQQAITAQRSQNDVNQNSEIYVGDTMGDMPLLYASADVAFIGGSLVPTGGHNPLEAAVIGLPIVFGQYMFNFKQIAEQLLHIKAAQQVNSVNELTNTLLPYLQQTQLRHQTGQRGQQFVAQNRGALQRLLTLIAEQQ